MAAENGHAAAQYNLGLMYANGEGVEQNMTKCKQWIQKAFENSDVGISQRAEDFWNINDLWQY